MFSLSTVPSQCRDKLGSGAKWGLRETSHCHVTFVLVEYNEDVALVSNKNFAD